MIHVLRDHFISRSDLIAALGKQGVECRPGAPEIGAFSWTLRPQSGLSHIRKASGLKRTGSMPRAQPRICTISVIDNALFLSFFRADNALA
ncbi:hypothetical protein PVV74_10365 [Roseovarius sp. SK2]|uniref:hypothetical protein n=1 Tax=Roseovarius TaxID=74030 RepID=UPI00237A94B9|nr:hypothetical protein [Roseovarius sp. SK2]MDD9725858.1 hypothetical protein [Roseovarius sp. SK2]